MPTPEDKEFFESINEKLADSIQKSLANALNSVELSLSQSTIKQLTSAVSSSAGGGEGEGLSNVANAATGAGNALSKATAALGLFRAAATNASRVFSGAVQGTFGFGSALARVTTQTNRQSILGMNAVRDASGRLQRFAFERPQIEDIFGRFGLAPDETGQMLASVTRANLDASNKAIQTFTARSVGLGNNINTMSEFLSTNINMLGLSTESTTEMGHNLLEVAKSNGVMADTIMEAANTIREATKEQAFIFGPEVAKRMEQFTASLNARMKFDVSPLITRLFSADPDQALGVRALAGMLDVDIGLRQAAPEMFAAEMISALARRSNEFNMPGFEESKGFLSQALGATAGLGLSQFQSAQRIMQEMSMQELANVATATANVATSMAEEAKSVRAADIEAATAAKDFAIFLGGAATQFNLVSQATEVVTGSLYDLNGGITDLADTLGSVAGVVSLGQAQERFFGMNITSALLGAGGISAAQKIFSMIRGGAPAAAGTSSAASTVAGGLTASAASLFGLSDAAQAAQSGRIPAGTPAPGGISRALGARSAAGGFIGGGTSRMANVGRLALRGGARRIPIVGGLVTGGLEYAETGDVSRAVTKGLGGAGGALAGAAAGAAIGSVVPILGTALGGIVGGILGGLAGESLAETVHDEFDPEFVAAQEKKRMAELRQAQTQNVFTGDENQLRREAERDSLAAAQLDEQRKMSESLALMAQMMSEDSGRPLPATPGQSNNSLNDMKFAQNVRDFTIADASTNTLTTLEG